MKHKILDIKESLFQQYIHVQNQHQVHRKRGKYAFNTPLLASPSVYVFTQTFTQQ